MYSTSGAISKYVVRKHLCDVNVSKYARESEASRLNSRD
jgi:hypothetical protein